MASSTIAMDEQRKTIRTTLRLDPELHKLLYSYVQLLGLGRDPKDRPPIDTVVKGFIRQGLGLDQELSLEGIEIPVSLRDLVEEFIEMTRNPQPGEKPALEFMLGHLRSRREHRRNKKS